MLVRSARAPIRYGTPPAYDCVMIKPEPLLVIVPAGNPQRKDVGEHDELKNPHRTNVAIATQPR